MLLENQAEYGIMDEEIAYVAGSMFGAGSDTVRIKAFDSLNMTLSSSGPNLFPLSDCFGDHNHDDGSCFASRGSSKSAGGARQRCRTAETCATLHSRYLIVPLT